MSSSESFSSSDEGSYGCPEYEMMKMKMKHAKRRPMMDMKVSLRIPSRKNYETMRTF